MKKKNITNKYTPKKRHPQGRKSFFESLLKPNYEKILELRSNGATIEKICLFLGCGESTFKRELAKRGSFRDDFTRARMEQEKKLVGKLWELAMGEAKTIEKYVQKDKKTGAEVMHHKEIQHPPSEKALAMLLKCAHGWKETEDADAGVQVNIKTESVSLRSQKAFIETLQKNIGLDTGLIVPRSKPMTKEEERKITVEDEDLDSLGA